MLAVSSLLMPPDCGDCIYATSDDGMMITKHSFVQFCPDTGWTCYYNGGQLTINSEGSSWYGGSCLGHSHTACEPQLGSLDRALPLMEDLQRSGTVADAMELSQLGLSLAYDSATQLLSLLDCEGHVARSFTVNPLAGALATALN